MCPAEHREVAGAASLVRRPDRIILKGLLHLARANPYSDLGGTPMATEQPSYRHRITQDPNILVGKPVVAGTRIPVELALAKLAANPDLEALFADYPRLTIDDVRACLDYARELVHKKARPHKDAAPAHPRAL